MTVKVRNKGIGVKAVEIGQEPRDVVGQPFGLGRGGVQLDAVSRRGSVELARDVTVDGLREEARVAGAIGGGGPLLRLYTARGMIRVGRR